MANVGVKTVANALLSLEGFSSERAMRGFDAYQVPCSIDYPLSAPVSEELRDLDYVEAWLAKLLEEARFLARFDLGDMVEHLESWCPDYRGLLINLYEPIRDLGCSHGVSAREP